METDFMSLQGFDVMGLRWYEDEQTTEFAIENHVWITADRREIPVASMSTNHINNVVRCWNGQGNMQIPASYLGGKEKWMKIFSEELTRRQ